MGTIGWLGAAYPWVKAVHLIAVIFWLAGLFMLPRFFAYHSEAAFGSPEERAWCDRERRLMRIILNPAMIATWLLGLTLLSNIGLAGHGWLHLKLLLVLLLSGYHGAMSKWRRQLADGSNRRSSRFFRMANEVPTLATIPIVILAIVQPF